MFRALRPMLLSLSFLSMPTALSFAQDEGAPPRAEMAAVAAQEYEQPREANGGYRTAFPSTYFSPTLRGHFSAQWMYITQNGRPIEFWGARIIRLEPGSPVRQLGLHPGDVITRLDGIPIWRGMYKEPGQPWQLPELENHFGRTEVRFILRGQNRVQIGDMMLDGSIQDGADDLSPIRP